ncbi:MAG: universal stress protein E [Paraglaciecola sp.]|jgi:universal stress protein E
MAELKNSIIRILVDIDPDKQEQPALNRALQFATQNKVLIKLLSCLSYPSIVVGTSVNQAQQDSTKAAIVAVHEQRLAALVKKNTFENITFETEVIWQSPVYLAILRAVDAFQADILIKASQPHSSVARHFFTPTDWYLLKTCKVPVLLVKQPSWSKQSTVVAALDPGHELSQQSELDQRILSAAFTVARQLDAPLHAVHCFNPGYTDRVFAGLVKSALWGKVFPAATHTDEANIMENLRYEHNAQFARECIDWVPNSANQHLLSGAIEQVLPSALPKLHAGILVLGTTYRSGLLGSTAQELVETVDCDILGVKPRDFEAPPHW